MSLKIDNLSSSFGKKPILKCIDLDNIPRGSLTALLGPNAAGKSTLFKNIAGILKPSEGRLRLDGEYLGQFNKVERFKRVCYMPQEFASHAMLTVFDVVLLARKNMDDFRVSKTDLEFVENLLVKFRVEHLAKRYIGELSGGQQQIVSLCQALARDAEVYLLDEPTSALDLGRQLQVMDVLQQEAQLRNAVFILAIHDLSLAARHAKQVIVMQNGMVRVYGSTEKVFSSSELNDVYNVRLELLKDSKNKIVVAASKK